MELLDEIHIANLIKELKLKGKRVQSNCFFRFVDEKKTWEVYHSDESIILIKEDNGVFRIFFYTIDFSDLKQLMNQKLSEDREYTLEIVGKDRNLYCDELTGMGFQVLARMSRLSIKDVSTYLAEKEEYQDVSVITAGVEDVSELKEKLWKIFDTRVSHLPNEEELKASIEKQEISLYRNDNGNITAFLQSVVEPRSFYINQVYNAAEKKVIHSIMYRRLAEYVENDGKYVYAWVDETNMASMRFHKKYGLEPDGLWTCVYVKE